MNCHSDSNYSTNDESSCVTTDNSQCTNTSTCTDNTSTCTDTCDNTSTCTDTCDNTSTSVNTNTCTNTTCSDNTTSCTDNTSTCTDNTSCDSCSESTSSESCDYTINSNYRSDCDTDSSTPCKSNTSKTSSNYTNDCTDISLGTITVDSGCNTSCSDCDHLLSNHADVFVVEHQCIHANASRGVNYDTPLVLGNNKLKNVTGVDKVKGKVMLAVDGDMYVSGNIYTGNHKSQHIYSSDINMQVKNDTKLDVVKDQHATYHYVDPKEVSSILYISPINGPVYIVLGKNGNVNFRENQEITIKDISLLCNEGASYNIYITVPSNQNTAIEHYGADCKLKVSSPGTYVLNTSNGSVTFRHMIGQNTRSCWLIESQFIGNPRVLPGTGLRFNQINPQSIKNLLK